MRYLVVFFLILLSGCGFHLRGSVTMPPELSELTVKGAVTDIAPDLRFALKNAGVRVTETASMVLQLRAEQYDKRVLSVDTLGRAQEYGLSYTVKFSLKDLTGRVWIPEAPVTRTRDLRFDPSAVLGVSNEEVMLNKEMRQDVISQILRQLQYAKRPVDQSVEKAK